MTQREINEVQSRKRKRRSWLVALGLLVVAIVVAGIVWFLQRPKAVSVVNPSPVTMVETIASSARVGGVKEAGVGSQFAGTVEKLFVRDGDHVKAGQPLAILKNDVTEQQKVRAEKEVQTAQSQLALSSRGPTSTELEEAEHQVTEAHAKARQARADLELARRDFSRDQQLTEAGIISKAAYDAAEAKVVSATALAHSAEATAKAREARLQTLKETPTPEDLQVARDRLAEAHQALLVAQEQVKDATVRAPFAGVVTAVNAEQGQTVGANGVVDLVSDDLEIRVSLDENNLAELAVGQPAVISSSAFGGKSFRGHLAEIGAAVNQERGTIMVKITSDHPPDWLRPGQTVNVNLITNEHAERLMIPASAVLKQGERSVVLVAENGHAVEKPVLTRPANAQGVPIAAGLTTADQVIVQPAGIAAGDAVRVRR
ncbi:MAG: efflux RND transporter periplasmic adaptor subunit [Acidobacteriaceae bacterium]